MRSVFLSLFIFVLAAGFVLAENKENSSKPVEGLKKGKISKLRGGKFSRMYIHLLNKTKVLELDQDQRDQIKMIGRPLIGPILSQENRSRKFQRRFMAQLNSPQFNPKELRTISNEIQEANRQAADNFIKAVNEVIEIIGPENYAKLRPITKIDRNALVQLREGNAEELMDAGKKDAQPKADTDK